MKYLKPASLSSPLPYMRSTSNTTPQPALFLFDPLHLPVSPLSTTTKPTTHHHQHVQQRLHPQGHLRQGHWRRPGNGRLSHGQRRRPGTSIKFYHPRLPTAPMLTPLSYRPRARQRRTKPRPSMTSPTLPPRAPASPSRPRVLPRITPMSARASGTRPWARPRSSPAA